MVSPEQAIDTITETFGEHPGYRVFHAKGVLCRGSFTASPEASRLTRAAHMQGEPVNATVRFSNGSGDPEEPDNVPGVRGMAAKLYLPDGSRTDIVAQTAPRFPVRTPEEFLKLIRIRKPGLHIVGMVPFLLTHLDALRAAREAAPTMKPPRSYATCRYYALHAFRWIDGAGGERFVRYRWLPEAGDQRLSKEETAKLGPGYLSEEIARRLGEGPARFELEAQIAEPGDPVDDASAAWPDDRTTVTVGTLELTGLETDREGEGDVLVFDPMRLTDGIEATDDPILRFRSPAYSESVKRRAGISRPPELDERDARDGIPA